MKIFKTKALKLHVIGWIIFIIYERGATFLATGKFANLWNYAANYSIDIVLFYVNAWLVFPGSFKHGRLLVFRLILMILAEIAIYFLYKASIFVLFGSLHITYTPVGSIDFLRSLWIFRAIYVIGISTGYWFALATLENQKRIKRLERSQLQNQLKNNELEKTLVLAENAFLKSQINPHFLLNTLNFLYNSVTKFSDQIADNVMTLSEIMRYALTNAGEDSKVRLEDEIDNITNFIKLNQARFSQRLCIDYQVNGEAGELRIIPLVLITLVENLFKYADLLNQTNPAKILAAIEGNELTFVTENLKKKNTGEKEHGIGLKNINQRLKMYHDYDLKIEENEQFYHSILTIRL